MSIVIDASKLADLKPCKDRFDNYLEHYSDFNGSINGFLDLEHITYDDKVWVAQRLLTKEQAVEWSCLCAESVLENYEKEYPGDDRPRKAIEAARSGENLEAALSAARSARLEALSTQKSSLRSAWSATRSAMWSAESALALDSATRLATQSAKSALESVSWSTSLTIAAQRQKNIELLKKAFGPTSQA
jgi:hypothetical protein